MNGWVTYLKQIKEIYDEKIPFKDYWGSIYPSKPYKFPCECDLHDEKHGHSFSYNEKLNIWSCFGHCNVRGQKVVEYHYRFLKKTNPGVTYVYAMEQLRNMFPQYHLPAVSDASTYYRSKSGINTESETRWASKVKNQLEKLDKNSSDMTTIETVKTSTDINVNTFKIFTNYYLTNVDKYEKGEDI